MPSLLNIIDNVPTGGKGQQSKLEAFFGAKRRESETHEQGADSESGAKLMNYLLSKRDDSCGGSSWDQKESKVVSNAEVVLRNRLQIQESKTGWRMGEDGVRCYSTYRGGQLVTGSGAEAMRLSMGDNKGKKIKSKSKSKEDRGNEKDTDKENKAGAKSGKKATKKKRNDAGGQLGSAKAPRRDANNDSKNKPPSVEVIQTRVGVDTSASAPPLKNEIQPQAYQGRISSQAGAVDDWGF